MIQHLLDSSVLTVILLWSISASYPFFILFSAPKSFLWETIIGRPSAGLMRKRCPDYWPMALLPCWRGCGMLGGLGVSSPTRGQRDDWPGACVTPAGSHRWPSPPLALSTMCSGFLHPVCLVAAGGTVKETTRDEGHWGLWGQKTTA